ncbi:glycosyltransferase family 2 protein [Alphaproteobacteria bacterium]|nr:glycosyltransferase family 2 protein [Alphaproteobacteria bacterium]
MINQIIKLSIIIPIFNEEKSLLTLLKKVKSLDILKEVIVVDDGSNDNTNKILKKNFMLYDKLITLNENKGKGYACRVGIKNANGLYLVIQDADLEYDPDNLYDMLKSINETTKVVYGSRALKGGTKTAPPGLRPYFSKFANYLLTKFSNLLSGQNLTDAHTCYKMFDTNLIKNIKLIENGFNFCPEINAKISKRNIKIKEVPINYFGRSYKDGKKIKLRHAFGALYSIIRYNFPYFR